ncbi:MAG: OmpA family protein [Caldimonas sp.]|uniref:OmpA family protein n=1 Tax=Caldimonas sp. TaxID=2838790 RepID=UPI00391BEA68
MARLRIVAATLLLGCGLATAAGRGELAPDQVLVTGTVPDEATRALVLQRLHELYGAHRVVDQIAIGSVVAPPQWSQHVQNILSPEIRQVSRGQLTVRGTQVDIQGEVSNEAQRQQVVSAVATRLNPTYTVRSALRVGTGEQTLIDQALANRIIEFEPGSSALTPSGRAVLDQMLPTLTRLSARRIEIIGHTDALGAPDANLALSLARADAVRSYLQARGIDAQRLAVSGMGSARPVASNETAEGRARNRRIEFRISQ